MYTSKTKRIAPRIFEQRIHQLRNEALAYMVKVMYQERSMPVGSNILVEHHAEGFTARDHKGDGMPARLFPHAELLGVHDSDLLQAEPGSFYFYIAVGAPGVNKRILVSATLQTFTRDRLLQELRGLKASYTSHTNMHADGSIDLFFEGQGTTLWGLYK